MREKSDRPGTGEQHMRDIRRATRRKWSSEEKIRIVLSGLRANTRLPSFAGVRGLPMGFITAGRRSSLRLARNACLAIPSVKQAPAK